LIGRSSSCRSDSVGSGRPSLSLTGSPSTIGSEGGSGAAGAAVGGGGVIALFLSGGSPLFLVEILLFSDIVSKLDGMWLEAGKPTLPSVVVDSIFFPESASH